MPHNLAPIVLFAYNRPRHTKSTLDALKRNFLAHKSELYIFLDSPKDSQKSHKILKRYLMMFSAHSHDFDRIHLTIRPYNYGLSRNIIEGLNAIFARYPKAIILEDDILTSPAFLDYMNTSLARYERESKVWSINAWALPLDYTNVGESFFSREINCWGWGIWRDRWQHYKKDPAYFLKNFSKQERKAFNLDNTIDYFAQITLNAKGKINTWFIFNYATAFKRKALALCPSISYVRNIGFDDSGIHCNKSQESFFSTALLNNKTTITYPESICENTQALELTKQAYREFYSTRLLMRLMRKTQKFITFDYLSNILWNLRLLYKNPLSRYLRNALKALFVRNHARIYENVAYSHCNFGKYTHIYPNAILQNVKVGDFSYIGTHTHISNTTIGKFCSIAPDCRIGLGLHPSRDFVSTHPAFYSTLKQAGVSFVQENVFEEHAHIHIGNDVWIGQNTIIKDGIHIGDGVIVGAGSVVTRDLLPYGIYGGTPARLIDFRFTREQIETLQKLQWWDLPLRDIRHYAPYFQNIQSLESLLENLYKTHLGGGASARVGYRLIPPACARTFNVYGVRLSLTVEGYLCA